MKLLKTHEATEYTGASIRTLYRYCRPIQTGRAGEQSLWVRDDLYKLKIVMSAQKKLKKRYKESKNKSEWAGANHVQS